MRSIQAAALAGGLLSFVAVAGAADPLPPTEVEIGAHSAFGIDLASDQFGTLDSSAGGTGAQASATADASLYTQVARNAGTAAGESVAFAHERYWFEVQGADGTVPVWLAGQGSVSVFGPYAMGGGVGSAITIGIDGGPLVVSGCTGGYLLQPCTHASSTLGPYSFSGSFDLQANTAYYVDLWTYSFLPPGQGGTSDIAWASARTALPAFAPDYAGAGAYSFTYSSPVPEPGPTALAATGLGLLVLARWSVQRRTRRARRAA